MNSCMVFSFEFERRASFNRFYSVLHSAGFRDRHGNFLKSDFPRIPIPGSSALFYELSALGRKLVALHLLDETEADILIQPQTRFAGAGERRVERGYPKYVNGKVMINEDRWFEDVKREVSAVTRRVRWR